MNTEHKSDTQSHNSLRPLREIIIHLECGCSVPIGSDPAIAPRVGLPLWCFTHMEAVGVTRVEYVR